MKSMKIISFLTALSLLFALVACGAETGSTDTGSTVSPSASTPGSSTSSAPSSDAPSPAPTQSADPAPSQSQPAVNAEPLHFTVLSGPTGVGAAKLLADVDAGTESGYEYTIAAANDEVVSMLSSGETDIAAMASNAALNLFNKTNGSVTVIALGTLGVLHIMESNGGTSIQSVKDLAGKTILAPGQGSNPEYILRYILCIRPGTYVVVCHPEYGIQIPLGKAGELLICHFGFLPEKLFTIYTHQVRT
jgi:NitT/TauT family transport system substrate-binding protein